ncbi:hypothetical protein OTU49_006435 [Cherax quadricarinatus]|uniref:Uncharacterized protein n=1 Tax=Cherax quadricarinatus TaxID=27406 RepID=A0AAW0X206_CHEQU
MLSRLQSHRHKWISVPRWLSLPVNFLSSIPVSRIRQDYTHIVTSLDSIGWSLCPRYMMINAEEQPNQQRADLSNKKSQSVGGRWKQTYSCSSSQNPSNLSTTAYVQHRLQGCGRGWLHTQATRDTPANTLTRCKMTPSSSSSRDIKSDLFDFLVYDYLLLGAEAAGPVIAARATSARK